MAFALGVSEDRKINRSLYKSRDVTILIILKSHFRSFQPSDVGIQVRSSFVLHANQLQ